MAVDGIKISALPELAAASVGNSAMLGYLDDTPKKNYQIRYSELKTKISGDIIDQAFNETSPLAQSGKAVKEAIKNLEAKVDAATGGNTAYIDGIKDELQAAINEKASKTELADTQSALEDKINAKADQTALDELSNVVDTKADRTELQELEATIDEKLEGKADASYIETSESKFNSIQNQLDSEHNELEYIKEQLDDLPEDLSRLKQEIDEIVATGTVSKDYVDAELAKKYDKAELGSQLTVITEDIINLYNQDEQIRNDLDLKADKTELPPIYEEIENVEKKIPEIDSFVSDYSDNPPSSSAVASYVTGQGYLTEADIEDLKPFTPESFETPTDENSATKQCYWFILDKSYFAGNKGFLSAIRIHCGEQEQEEDDEMDEEDEWMGGGYGYSSYISLAVCKWDGTSLIPIGYSNDYVEVSDDTWVSFGFDSGTIAITGEDDIAFVFADNPQDTQISNPIAQLLKVGVICKTGATGNDGVYLGNGGDTPTIEKFTPEVQVDYNLPMSPNYVQKPIEHVIKDSDEAVMSSGIYSFVESRLVDVIGTDNNEDIPAGAAEGEDEEVEETEPENPYADLRTIPTAGAVVKYVDEKIAEIGPGGDEPEIELADEVTADGENAVKSSGIYSFVDNKIADEIIDDEVAEEVDSDEDIEEDEPTLPELPEVEPKLAASVSAVREYVTRKLSELFTDEEILKLKKFLETYEPDPDPEPEEDEEDEEQEETEESEDTSEIEP